MGFPISSAIVFASSGASFRSWAATARKYLDRSENGSAAHFFCAVPTSSRIALTSLSVWPAYVAISLPFTGFTMTKDDEVSFCAIALKVQSHRGREQSRLHKMPEIAA